MRFYFVAGSELTAAVSFDSDGGPDAEPDEASLREGIERLRREGVRLIVAEFPELPAFRAHDELLRAHGFSVESVVPDYFSDGVAMRILVMRPQSIREQA